MLTVLLLLFCLPSHRPSLLFSQTFRAVPLTVPELTCWKECFCFYFISSFLESSSDWSSVRWTSLHGLGLGQREAAGSPTQSPFMCCMLTQSCPILCGPMDHSLPGSSIHGISQARILEWVAISSSRELPNPGMEYTSPALALDFLPLSHNGSPSECMHRCSYLSID